MLAIVLFDVLLILLFAGSSFHALSQMAIFNFLCHCVFRISAAASDSVLAALDVNCKLRFLRRLGAYLFIADSLFDDRRLRFSVDDEPNGVAKILAHNQLSQQPWHSLLF